MCDFTPSSRRLESLTDVILVSFHCIVSFLLLSISFSKYSQMNLEFIYSKAHFQESTWNVFCLEDTGLVVPYLPSAGHHCIGRYVPRIGNER